MLSLVQLFLRHPGLLIEEAPFEDAPKQLSFPIHRVVAECVPVNAVNDGDSHDGSVDQWGGGNQQEGQNCIN